MSRPPGASALRVLVVTGSYPPEHSGSGLRIAATYGRLASRRGVDHTVVTRAPQGVPTGPVATAAVRVAAGPAPVWAWALSRAVWRHARAVDVAHLTTVSFETRVAALVLRLRGVPYTVEPTVDPTPPPPRWHPARWFAAATDQLLFGNRWFVAMTTAMAARHRPPARGVSACHLRPNPYYREALDDASASTTDVAARDRPGTRSTSAAPSDGERVRHLVLGRLCPRKGHAQALRWLRGLPVEHELTIAGPLKGPDDAAYLRDLERTIADDPRLRGRVDLRPGYVADPVPLLRDHDTAWLPSTLEGMPNVAVEALCQGTPVVMGAWLSATEWLAAVPGSGVAVERDDATATAAITGLSRTLPDRAGLAAAAREVFDLDRHVDALHGHLTRVAGHPRRGRTTGTGRPRRSAAISSR